MSLPPIPDPPNSWRAWLTGALQLIYAGQQALSTNIEAIMSQQDAFQSALDRQSAATASAVAGITREIQQLKDAVEALSTSNAPTQAQLDQINASAAALEQAASSLSADDTAETPPSGGTAPA